MGWINPPSLHSQRQWIDPERSIGVLLLQAAQTINEEMYRGKNTNMIHPHRAGCVWAQLFPTNTHFFQKQGHTHLSFGKLWALLSFTHWLICSFTNLFSHFPAQNWFFLVYSPIPFISIFLFPCFRSQSFMYNILAAQDSASSLLTILSDFSRW